MENPSNPNLCGGREDEENRQSVYRSSHIDQLVEDPLPIIGVLKEPWINQTAAETEPMSQPQLGQLQFAGLSSLKSQIATDIRKKMTPQEIPETRRTKLKDFFEKCKEEQMRKSRIEEFEAENRWLTCEMLKSQIENLQAENRRLTREMESPKIEKHFVNLKFETLLEQLKALQEHNQQMKSNLTVLKHENEFLKKDNVLLKEELDKLKKNEKMRTGNPSKENSKPITTFSGSSEDVGNKHSVGGSSASIARHLQNQDLSIGAQNLPKINQIATEAEPMRQQQSGQCQLAKLSANSQSSRDITEITAAKRARERAHDRTCRERVKELQMKSNPETLWSENECLKKENDFLNMFEATSGELGILNKKMRTTGNLSMEDSKPITTYEVENRLLRSDKEFLGQEIVSLNPEVEIQLKELDELRKNFDELKKKYEEQHERIRQLEHDIRTRDAKIEDLNDRYIAVLENLRNASENTRSEIPLDKSAEQPVPRTNSPGNSDCGSGTGA